MASATDKGPDHWSDHDLRIVLDLLKGLKRGDFSNRIPVVSTGLISEIYKECNDLADMHIDMSEDIAILAEATKSGRLSERISRDGRRGSWSKSVVAINDIVDSYGSHIEQVMEAVAGIREGDFRTKNRIDQTKFAPTGAFAKHLATLDALMAQLDAFGQDVTELALNVGVEGKLGGQLDPTHRQGSWGKIVDSLNVMASNLTDQIRDISLTQRALGRGDLTRKATVECQGEVNDLKNAINDKVDLLRNFHEQLSTVSREVGIEGQLGGQAHVPAAVGVWKDLTTNINTLARNLSNQVRAISEVARAVTLGDYTQSVEVDARGEISLLKDNVNQMVDALAESTALNEQQDWLKSNLAAFTQMLQGERELETVAGKVISELARVIDAQHGAFYAIQQQDEKSSLKLLASYAYRKRKFTQSNFQNGEGLVSQCAKEKRLIRVQTIPEDYIKIESGLGSRSPKCIILCPILHEDETKGVVELASFHEFSEIEVTFLEQFFETLGTIMTGIEQGLKTVELLKQSQGLTEELQKQQEELQQTNEELEEKAREVLKQNEEVERKNIEVETARLELEEKADLLSRASKYKSEFLANMSHELRTPLNSLLILSQQLAENGEKNLLPKQIEHAKTIYASGKDLLSLINEVLDLAKVESGTMDINVTPVSVEKIVKESRRSFEVLARKKGLNFDIETKGETPKIIETDEKRLMQILRNLLSNAIKFTEQGSVTLSIKTNDDWHGKTPDMQSKTDARLEFSVRDTGIGIDSSRFSQIFEAFQQADGSTSRKFGGTGLGLSISREIASYLGGEIHVDSDGKTGSTFTLVLPQTTKSTGFEAHSNEGTQTQRGYSYLQESPKSFYRPDYRTDEFEKFKSHHKKLLIIEDDPAFADVIEGLAKEHGFGVHIAPAGEMALQIARTCEPDAITLDLILPDMHGWVVLDRLKRDPKTRHIPVHIMSCDENLEKGLLFGAIDILQKPVDRQALIQSIKRISQFLEKKVRNLLIVEDDEVQRKSIIELIGNSDVVSFGAESGEQAIELLKERQMDCMVVDLKLPKMSGIELIQTVRSSKEYSKLPIVIYTGRELTRRDEMELRKLTEAIIVKDANSPERLLDETALFLHRVEEKLPQNKRAMLRSLYEKDPSLVGRKVLIVDDDARNIFATTAILERYEMEVFTADSARKGIDILKDVEGIEIVLMDIMMPEMDGFQAIAEIRKTEKIKTLPIIALTAKAMPEDRSKCIEAGASDYIVKPVDSPQLVSLLRVWLYR